MFSVDRIRSVLLSVVLWIHFVAQASITVEPWVPLYEGIDYAAGHADTNEIRLQRVFALRVDLQDPSIEMFSTPAGGPKESVGQTTTTFVSSYGLKVGVNANFFSPVSTTPNDPRDLSGLALSRGQVVSPVETFRPMLLVTSNNVASIVSGSFVFEPTNYWTGVAGSDRVLINGVVQTFAEGDFTTGNHPRTAVGVSQDGRYLVMMVIDGRQPTWSNGAPLSDVGAWLMRFGCHQGVNLDGGGSTTMVKAQNGTVSIVNKPSGGVQRVNGNHLGVFSQEIAPVFVTAPQDRTILEGDSVTLSALAGGTTPLRFQWQFSGNNIAGATNSTFTITNASTAHTGNYTLVVSNHMGTLAESAFLNVNYGLVTNAGLGGVISKSPNTPNHPPNSTVTLTAMPDPGFVFTGWSGDIQGTDNPVTVAMTGHKNVSATFSGFPTQIIVDTPQATFSNTWTNFTIAADKFGTNYRVAGASSSIVRTATFRPVIYTPGRYAVYIWYPTETQRATNAPWTVFFNGGAQLTRVNQNLNGGRWNLISPGKDFLRGTNSYVVLRNTNSAPVTADAVKFVYGNPPSINKNPQNQTVVVGSQASFTVTASGTAPLAYQWFQNGTIIAGATNNTVSITNASASHAGIYAVSVTNLFGAVTSSNAQLIVTTPPNITSHPQSQSVAQATDVTFSVSVQGTDPFSYLWFFNGAALTNARSSVLSIANVQTNDSGNYSVRVINVAGVTFSSNATLTVSTIPVGPTFVLHPQSQTVIAGQDVVLQARAKGTLPLSYQWQFEGIDVPGAMSSTLVLSNVQPANAGHYSVRVGNQVSSTNSIIAQILVNHSLTTVAEVGGVITNTPQQASYPSGSILTISALPDVNFAFAGWSGGASGTNNPLTITIQSNTVVTAKFAGAVNDIIIDNPAALYAGVWSIGSTANGRLHDDYHFAGTSSSNATSTATYRPNITTPGSYNVYLWYPQGSNRASNAPWEIVSEDETRLVSVNQMTGGGSWQLISEGQYFARGTNGYVRLGNNANNSVVIADGVRWAFIYPPTIVWDLTNQVVAVGTDVVLSLEVHGTGPMHYQWFFNESPLPGSSNNVYNLGSAQLSHAGRYSVTVSNAGGTVESAQVRLTVVPSPVPLRFESITPSAEGLRFALESQIRLSFAIEGSTNLADWTVLTNFTDSLGAIEFVVPSVPNGNRFYRARITR